MKVQIKQSKRFGLECFQVVIGGVVLHTFMSLAGARTKYLELLNKGA